MDGWTLGLILGMVGLVGLVILLGRVVKAAATTAATAQAVLAALDEVRANTAPLAGLDSLASGPPGHEAGGETEPRSSRAGVDAPARAHETGMRP